MKYINRPCDECPWRCDAETGRFTNERWDSLARSSADRAGFGPDLDAPLFACHKTPEGGERACAGWLAREGHNHPIVRLATLRGEVPLSALDPGEDWPLLFDSFWEARDHDLSGA